MNETEAHNGGGNTRGLRPGVLLVIVCVAGAFTGMFFGALATIDHNASCLGIALGGFGGLLAGIVWTRIMLRPAKAGCHWYELMCSGTGWGIVVGLMATVILHGGLGIRYLVRGPDDMSHFMGAVLTVAFVCAVFGGAITGAVCGAIVAAWPGEDWQRKSLADKHKG